MTQLRTIAIHRALNRPDLLAGCERELFLGMALIVAMLVFTAINIVAAIAGIVIWSLCIWGLRLMAANDPVMSKVYLRHIKYEAYYPARSTPFARLVDYKNKKWGV